jgi:hypothetical protein
LGRELARWQVLAVGRGAMVSLGFPVGLFFSVSVARVLRFQLPPVEPCVRFSRTRLTDALHRRCSAGARQARLGLGATTMPLREIRPSALGDR